MTARKGERPFVGLTNSDRKAKAGKRRDAILSYLRSSPERISAIKLASLFGVSLRTIMYDLKYLFKSGHASELRPKFLEFAHCIVPTDTIKRDSKKCPYNNNTISDIKRGKQLRSGGIHYYNVISFSRSRLSFREYQVLHLLLKDARGELPGKLYKKYEKFYYDPVSYDKFKECLYRLVSLKRVFYKPISAKQQIYFAYPIPPKLLECGFSFPASGMAPPKKQAYANLTNYNSYIGKSPYSVKIFTNKSKNKLFPPKYFRVEFNSGCECGGSLTTSSDGMKFCRSCGLVINTMFIPGIENVPAMTGFIHGDVLPRVFSKSSEIKTPFESY